MAPNITLTMMFATADYSARVQLPRQAASTTPDTKYYLLYKVLPFLA